MDTDTPADGTCNSAPALPNTPKGGSGLAAAVGGAAITSFQFSALGATNRTGAITITIDNSPNITVESSTGFVND